MKKIISTLTAVVLVFTLAACSAPIQQGEKSMIIKPREFSEETLSVLEFVGEDVFFFDFTVDDTVKSYTVDAWIFDGATWITYGSTSGNIDAQNNSIAIKVTDTGYDIKTSDNSGFIGYSSDAPYSEFDNTTQIGSYKLTNPTTILADTEITLWSKIGNKENGMSTTKDFRNADCTAGMAFTVTFSNIVLD